MTGGKTSEGISCLQLGLPPQDLLLHMQIHPALFNKKKNPKTCTLQHFRGRPGTLLLQRSRASGHVSRENGARVPGIRV